MRNFSQAFHEADLQLARSAAQDAQTWQRLVDRYSSVLWRLCTEVCTKEDCEAAFGECWRTLREHDCSVLRRYDGRASLGSYLQFVFLDALARRLQTLLSTDPARGWAALQKLLSQEIRRQTFAVIGSTRQLAAAGVLLEDIYQDISLAMIADDFHRLRAYDGHGSFVGYIRRVVRNLCLDWKRSQHGRRRLPAAIERMGETEQEAYRCLYWHGCSAEEAMLRLRNLADPQVVQDVVLRVQEFVESSHSSVPPIVLGSGFDMEREQVLDPAPSPEQIVLNKEQTEDWEKLRKLIHEALCRLPVRQQFYVRLRFFADPPLTPRQIADVLGVPQEEVYRIRQHVTDAFRMEFEQLGLDAEKLTALLDERRNASV